MEKLNAEQQAEVKKTSTERLRVLLVKAGYNENDVAGLERADVVRLFAEYLATPTPANAATGGTETPGDAEEVGPLSELVLRQRELALRQQEWEWKKKEKAEKAERAKQEFDLRCRELKLREQEVERQKRKDEDDKKRRDTLAGQTRFYGDAMKHALPRMSNDASELPSYFKAVENLFLLYDVPQELQSKLIIPMLTERAKALIARLSKERLDKYEEVRDYLLREFRLSAEQYRDKFLSATKQSDETYTLFGSRVRNFYMYYLDSRKAVSREDVIDLMIADRIKRVLPDHCLKHVLSVESDSWLKPDRLTQVIDVYMNSYVHNSARTSSGCTSETVNPATRVGGSGFSSGVATGSGVKDDKRPIRCWRCSKLGHRASDCKVKVDNASRSLRTEQSSNVSQTRTKANVNHANVTSRDDQLTGYDSVSEHVMLINNHNNVVEPCKERLMVSEIDDNMSDINQLPLSELQYSNISIRGVEGPLVCLNDSGAEISMIKQAVIQHLDVPKLGTIAIKGVVGEAVEANVVSLNIKPCPEQQCENIAPYIPVLFAACNLSTDVDVILCGDVVKQLEELNAYNVLRCSVQPQSTQDVVNADVVTTRSGKTGIAHNAGGVGNNDTSGSADSMTNVANTNNTGDTTGGGDNVSDVTESVTPVCDDGDHDALREEQLADDSLKRCWSWANLGKGNFYIRNGILYHLDQVLGQRVEQLCLPKGRRLQVCKLAHDLCHQGYKKTKEKIRLSFYWDSMNKTVKEYVDSCVDCQRKARVLMKDRVPISVIPRDVVPFSHLYMDVIGPLFDKAEYNYCLCITDSCSRFPFAFPLRAVTAKAVCECLIQVFSLVGISSVITSDQGSCFTAKLTQEFLRLFGCSPRWSTPLHPEGNSLVERLNQTVKKMLHHVCKENPKQWNKLLPLVLWTIRESKNDTLGLSPQMMLFGRTPNNTLHLLKESWTGENALPVSAGKSVVNFLSELQHNLKVVHDYAESHAKSEQQRYVSQYNKRARDKNFEIGDQVIVLIPDSTNKLMSCWQGPATVVDVKHPYSCLVELNQGQRRWLHANKLRHYHARVNEALVNNCAIVYDRDEEFGTLPVAETVYNNAELPSSCIDPSRLDHLTLEQRQQFLAVLDDFPEVFVDRPGLCKVGMHSINVTPDFKPKRLKSYRVPELLKPEVARQLQELTDLGFIRPSDSEMASPIVCVLKGRHGENGIRLCCDFRYLNKYTRSDSYPTPDINDVIHKVGKATYISTWDARSGYWQLRVRPEHQWLTAFVTDFGVFEWTRMPFGLKCASNSFIRAVQQIIQPMRDFCDSYVDDLATFSCGWDEHLGHVREFLSEIRESGMTLNLKKCSFAEPQVVFVGHVIGSGMHGPDLDKVSSVQSMKPPTNKKEVRQVLGFFSYFRSYIENFACISKPLTELTKTYVPNKIQWTDTHHRAFETLKECLCAATKLHVIEYGKPCGIFVDSSNFAVGCCLVQWSDEGLEKPIAFASSQLSQTQASWSVVEKEAYAVMFALRKFCNFLFAAKVTVFSDHNPLVYLKDCAPRSAKLTRWALALQEFDLSWSYKPGHKNLVADCLSRLR